jgi:hypothetical protein
MTVLGHFRTLLAISLIRAENLFWHSCQAFAGAARRLNSSHIADIKAG